ncbi:MAG: hypothetical protein GX898_05490 [Corynebacterium sp.]|nr:hypothetical protein [Corynebacterium sp.]
MSNFHAIRTAVLISAFSITLAACSTPGDLLGDTAATTDASVTTTAPGARSPENGDTATSSVKSGAPSSTPTTVEDTLRTHGLSRMDSVEMINHLDRLPVDERPTDMLASIQQTELLISTGTEETTLPLPEGQAYISIAPYAEQTHTCHHHSLTTCLGELANEPVTVTIRDDNSGEILIQQDTITYDNGFIGFWLPTDLEGTIEISHDGRSGSTPFSTREDGATCVTTLQVA